MGNGRFHPREATELGPRSNFGGKFIPLSWGLALGVVCLFYGLQLPFYLFLRFIVGINQLLPDLFLWVTSGYLSFLVILLGSDREADPTPNGASVRQSETTRPAHQVVRLVGWFVLVKTGLILLEVGFSRVLPERSNIWADTLLASGWVTVGCLGPLLEESFFRWYLMERLLGTHSERNCILFSSIVFALGHGTLREMAMGLLFGLFLSWVYVRTRTLFFPIVFHAANNLLSLLILEAGRGG